MTPEDKTDLRKIIQNGNKFGDTLTELSTTTGLSVGRLASLGRKYDGRRMRTTTGRIVRIVYYPPQNHSFKSCCPGIKNPNNGIAARIAAEISVHIN